MKRISTKKILAACIIFSISMRAHTQTIHPKYEFGINIGFLVYQGDLTPERLGSFRTQKLAWGLHASRIFNSSFSVRGNFVYGKLRGDDALYNYPGYRKQRNFNFTTPVLELSGQLVWNPASKNYIEKGFSPYLFAGAGFSLLQIKRDWSNINTSYFDPETSGTWAGLAADSSHSLPRLLPVIPVGAGVKYFIYSHWAVNAEVAYRVIRTDYLDGFSKSANPTLKDHYFGYSAGIIYRTGKMNKMDCPVIKY